MQISRSIIGMVMAAIITFCISSCNGSMSPATNTQYFSNAFSETSIIRYEASHNLIGLYSVYIDLRTLNAEVAPLRAGEGHYNVTAWLKPPYCNDCFKIKIIDFSLNKLELTAEVTVKNFTQKLTGYDVRGIVYPKGNYILKNAYAYTYLYAPGSLEQPAGFRAYDTADPDRALNAQESSTETYIIGFPQGATFVDLLYAIDASWPDHCPEAYDISGFTQTILDNDPGSSAQISVYVFDWQNDTKKVTINTNLLDGSEVQLSHISGNLWTGTITNGYGLPVGKYPCLISARDTVSQIQLYQWVNVQVLNADDTEPPTWVDTVGITDLQPGLKGMLIKFGPATDPSIPVTYNLYWSKGENLDFNSANVIKNNTSSPILLLGLEPGVYSAAIRAEDAYHNETKNTNTLKATVGIHPNVQWIDGPSMKVPRGYSGGFLANGFFWVLGGYASGSPLSKVERYNISTNTWDSPWELTKARDSFGCGTAIGKAYIFGGRFGETEVTDTCQIIDLATGTVDPNPPVLPMAIANPGCGILDNTFYIAGGRNFTGSSWVYYPHAWKITPPSKTFEPETSMEFATAMMGFATSNEYMMTCGGYPQRPDVLYHLPNTKSWQFMAPLESGREYNCAVLIDDWLYSIGGLMIDIAFGNVDVLNVKTNTWYSINPLNRRRFGATVATDGAYIYVAGGFTTTGPAYVPLGSLEIGKIF